MEMTFDSRRTDICARNGRGKSSLMYAWLWVLGMDVPDVIPAIDNKELHHLETKVTAIVVKDTSEYKLERTQSEEWKTNRVTGIEEKHGNLSTYSIDDIDFTLKVYKDKLSWLLGCSHDKLEMLTQKDYFNTDKPSKWTWTQRRKELNELTGTAELLKGLTHKSEYSLISDDLQKGFSATEIKKSKTKALKGISDEKDRNVTLIEDKQNDIAKYAAVDYGKLEILKDDYDKKITALSLTVAKADEADASAELDAKINALVSERTNLGIADHNEQQRLKNIVDGYTLKKAKVKNRAAELKSRKVNVEDLQRLIEEKKALTWNGATTCPTCGQELPSGVIEASKQRFEQAVTADIAKLTEQAVKGNKVNADIEDELKIFRKQYAELESDENIAFAELDNFESNPRIAALDAEIAALKARKSEMPTNTESSVKSELSELRAHLADIQSRLAYKGVMDGLKSRVEELKAANRELTDKEMILKNTIRQIDAYVAESVSLVTDTINAMFSNNVSFALFSENYAGAEAELKETCVCMYKGKVYSSMSGGEKFIANLEVVKALQRAYGVSLPLFCDEAECFTEELPESEQQIIMLNATPDKVLDNCIYVQKG